MYDSYDDTGPTSFGGASRGAGPAINRLRPTRISISKATSGLSIVGLMTQLYAAGERNMPPPSPTITLEARTVHSLYAISFLVYATSVSADWLHAYYACQPAWTLATESSVSFALRPPAALSLIGCCVVGTVLTLLLMVLCIEHAFSDPPSFDPFQGGCAILTQRLRLWCTGFNGFRISFLMMLGYDLPMTFINLWFISSCRIINEDLKLWPVVLSCVTTMVSLSWRLVMLYYSYRHQWFFRLDKENMDEINRESSTVDELKSIVGLRQRDRLSDIDECWPVRYSVEKVYHGHRDYRRPRATASSGVTQYSSVATHDDVRTVEILVTSPSAMRATEDQNCNAVIASASASRSSSAVGGGRAEGRCPDTSCLMARLMQACCCVSMCLALSVGMVFVGCLPCLYHYCCKKNALYHRHKFAKSCSRIWSTGYHMFVVMFSLSLTVTLLIVNLVWLSSVHLIGKNSVPPEINQLCIRVNTDDRTIEPSLLPHHVRLYSNVSQFFVCKPIFEDTSTGLGFLRQKPTPWKLLRELSTATTTVESNLNENGGTIPKILTVWMEFRLNYRRERGEMARNHAILFDFQITDQRGCRDAEDTGWQWNRPGANSNIELPWPYYSACSKGYAVVKRDFLQCNSSVNGMMPIGGH